jgi:N-acetylneuraminic acid mutarotase
VIPINVPGRIGHTINSLQNDIYICFGSEKNGDSRRTAISTIYKSNGNSFDKDWTQISFGRKGPSPRSCHSSVSCNDKLYFTGGVVHGQLSNTISFFEPPHTFENLPIALNIICKLTA